MAEKYLPCSMEGKKKKKGLGGWKALRHGLDQIQSNVSGHCRE